MNSFFSHLLEASLILLVLYIFFFVVIRHKAPPAFNRFYLLFSLLFALVVPALSIPIILFAPGQQENLIAPATQAWNFLPELVIGGSSSNTKDLGTNSIGWISISTLIYFSGMGISLAFSAWKLLKLNRLIRQFAFRPKKDEEGNFYHITDTKGRFPTFSFLNYIFWDNTSQLSKSEAAQILRHELGHVKQKHSLDLLVLELLTALFWFNPLIYGYRISLREVHEHLADRFAVAHSEQASYLKLMVKQTLHQANIPFASQFFQHNTLNRIRMLQITPKHPILKGVLSSGLMLSLLFVSACEEEPKDAILAKETGQLNQQETSSTLSIQEESPDQIFEIVEEMPVPKGGMESFYQTLGENLKYPEEAAKKGIEGRVYVQFVLEEDGAISNVKVVKGVGHGLDEAAMEAIKTTSGQWEAGRQNGKAVRTRMVMPIMFKL